MNTLTYSPRDFIQEICKEENIKFESLSQDYISRLTKGDITRHVVWSNWDINNAAADRIACDKCACYTVLELCGVPAIPHFLLQHPYRRQGWVGERGTWALAVEHFYNFGQKAVLKPNRGTNGHGIHLCDSVSVLEAAVHAIFESNPDVAICPFRNIATEYRVFYVNGKMPLVYGKKPAADNWRHNLSQGATAFELCNTNTKREKIQNIANKAAEAIAINFATIDIVELDSGEYEVMEINSGVQARQMLEQMPHLRHVVKEIYAEAVRGMFD